MALNVNEKAPDLGAINGGTGRVLSRVPRLQPSGLYSRDGASSSVGCRGTGARSRRAGRMRQEQQRHGRYGHHRTDDERHRWWRSIRCRRCGGRCSRAPPKAPFDWVGVIGTGQSLSVGATAGKISTTQPFTNLKLVDNGPDPKYPIDSSGMPQWAAVPLVEPIRTSVPGSAPATATGNIQ